ncbi:helix-turn-helix domain-containing protein [Lonepinella koalarum]|uniref:Putative transcriptional regulator n=1 Tax=Lonepinella koalarum TaxID=53417 RepID=A0A4R1KV95_9PAST|nr:helix-turn-helix domain-containing protein [Lonepinella koalarum]MDH2927181.1 transcriptional regulator [Lonepinella koalarum]TCK68149.1 putative transcriptional regulator [Lonepinella koalarum]TFJ89457.1 helix-turn-helix domain-containing protein [Lonepinella koalarum]TYG33507.1 helix-turn-helix domain-containing protein [Lonepinella koalarum]
MERNLFNEIKEGLEQIILHEQGKITLKTTTLELPDDKPVDISATEVKTIREKLNLSQAVFAKKLRTSVRTYQGWEQGKSKPNPQAILLLKMVDKSPAIFEQISRL